MELWYKESFLDTVVIVFALLCYGVILFLLKVLLAGSFNGFGAIVAILLSILLLPLPVYIYVEVKIRIL